MVDPRLDQIVEYVGAVPSGVGIDEIHGCVGTTVPRRTLQYWMARLVEVRRLDKRGSGPSTRYVLPTAIRAPKGSRGERPPPMTTIRSTNSPRSMTEKPAATAPEYPARKPVSPVAAAAPLGPAVAPVAVPPAASLPAPTKRRIVGIEPDALDELLRHEPLSGEAVSPSAESPTGRPAAPKRQFVQPEIPDARGAPGPQATVALPVPSAQKQPAPAPPPPKSDDVLEKVVTGLFEQGLKGNRGVTVDDALNFIGSLFKK